MPLDRRHVTAASWIMFPTYITFSGALGLTWLLQDQDRTNRSLTALATWWPVPYTGAILASTALTLAAALATRSRLLGALALAAGVVEYALLGFVFLTPLQLHLAWGWPFIHIGAPDASLSAPLWPWFVAMAHLASLVSVLLDEFTDARGNHPGTDRSDR